MAGADSIKILRGTEAALNNNSSLILSDGQPLYDKTNNWLCIGNGGSIGDRQSISIDFNLDSLTDEDVENIWGGVAGDGSLPGGGISSDLISSLQDGYVPYLDGTTFKSTKLYPDADGIRVASTINNQVAGLNWNGAWSTDGGSHYTFVPPGLIQLMNSLYDTRIAPFGIQVYNRSSGAMLGEYSFPVTKSGKRTLAVTDDIVNVLSLLTSGLESMELNVTNMSYLYTNLSSKVLTVEGNMGTLTTQVNTNKNNIASLTTRVSSLESSGGGGSGGGSSVDTDDIRENRFGGIGWNHVLSAYGLTWSSTAGLASGHNGVTDWYIYSRQGDSNIKMMVLDIWVEGETELTPQNKSISILGGAFTKWECAYVPIFAAAGGADYLMQWGFKRMEVETYNWIRDTNTNIGILNGSGYIVPRMLSNTADEGRWFPYVGGVAIELDDYNKSNNFKIEKQHMVVRLYNY